MVESMRNNRPPALRRPRLSVILIVMGLVLIGVSVASYWRFRDMIWSRRFSEDQIVGVSAYRGQVRFSHNFQPDRRTEHETHRDYPLVRIIDYVTLDSSKSAGYVASRVYSTNTWFWGAVFLAIGIRGYVKQWVVPIRRLKRDRCVVCGYDSRGNAGEACPECGAVVAIEKETACEDAGRYT